MKRSQSAAASVAKKIKLDSIDEKSFGKIEKITLRNFMCHENFEFQFGPRMNFIIGQNGSGKSAILTGLILALGSKSSVTGRFTNVKGFIKTGKQGAKIEVILNNTGEVPFKPELYGSKIAISREFNINGNNSYKMKSESGKLISNAKAELISILNTMDIHVENPVQVLTQETSRTFLLSKHAKGDKLYEFFFKGTGLQALEDGYKTVQRIKSESQEKLDIKTQALPVMRKEMQKWKKFLDSSEKIVDYEKQLVWAGVIEMEKIVQKRQEDVIKIENEIKINKEEMEKCKVMLDTKTKDLDELAKKKSKSSSVLSEFRDRVQKLKSDHETCTSSLLQYEADLAFHIREETKMACDMENLENRINENTQRTQIDVTKEENERLAKIAYLKKENQAVNEKKLQLENLIRQKLEEQETERQKKDNIVVELQSMEYNQRKLKDNINRLQMALKNKVNVFGDYTQRVLNDIKACRNFKKVPIGPIGMYLKVKDPSWSPAIEKCLSQNLLCSYCVDNHSDDRILKEIFRKHCGNRMPSTIVCPFSEQVYDVTQHKAQTDFSTVLDMLHIQNVQVANALIDQSKIEHIILIEDTLTGQDAMLNPPRNVFAAYIKNCDQICLNPYRYYSETNSNRNSLLSSLGQDEIIRFNNILKDLVSQTNSKQEEQRHLDKRINTIPLEVKNLNQQMLKCKNKLNDNVEKIKDLECVTKTEDVYCLQEDLTSLKQEKLRNLSKVEELQAEVAKYKEEKNKIIAAKENLKSLLTKEKAVYDDLSNKIQQFNHEKETLSTGQTRFDAEAKDCEKKLQAAIRDLESNKSMTEESTKKAENKCERINVTSDIETIRLQLAATKKVVEEQSNSNKDEVAQRYREKLRRFREAEVELKRIKGYLTKLEEMLALRCEVFKTIMSHTQSVVDLAFIPILSGNGYAGSLKFDNKNRILKLEVAPKKNKTTRQNHGTLSGGERSYVTLAFILSLWERTKMPFRILDEYDVFMDSSNRQLSVDLLIKKAQEMDNTQFIFLSPLDLPQIKNSENIKIHQMVPPKRIDM